MSRSSAGVAVALYGDPGPRHRVLGGEFDVRGGGSLESFDAAGSRMGTIQGRCAKPAEKIWGCPSGGDPCQQIDKR